MNNDCDFNKFRNTKVLIFCQVYTGINISRKMSVYKIVQRRTISRLVMFFAIKKIFKKYLKIVTVELNMKELS